MEFGYYQNDGASQKLAMAAANKRNYFRACVDIPFQRFNRDLVVKAPEGLSYLFKEHDVRPPVGPTNPTWAPYSTSDIQFTRCFRLHKIFGKTGTHPSSRALKVEYEFHNPTGGSENSAQLSVRSLHIFVGNDAIGWRRLLTFFDDQGSDGYRIDAVSWCPDGGHADCTELGDVYIKRWSGNTTSGDETKGGLDYVGYIVDQVGRTTYFDYEPDERQVGFPTRCAYQREPYSASRLKEIKYPTGGRTEYAYVDRDDIPFGCTTQLNDEFFLRTTGRSAVSQSIVGSARVYLDEASSLPTRTTTYEYDFVPGHVHDINHKDHVYRTTVTTGPPFSPEGSSATPDEVVRRFEYRKAPYFMPHVLDNAPDEDALWETLLVEEQVSGQELIEYVHDASLDLDENRHRSLENTEKTVTHYVSGGVASYEEFYREFDEFGNITLHRNALGDETIDMPHNVIASPSSTWEVPPPPGIPNPDPASAVSTPWFIRVMKERATYKGGTGPKTSLEERDIGDFENGCRVEERRVAVTPDGSGHLFASTIYDYDVDAYSVPDFNPRWAVSKVTGPSGRVVHRKWVDENSSPLELGGPYAAFLRPDWMERGDTDAILDYFSYDRRWEVLSHTGPDGYATDFVYDEIGRIQAVRRETELAARLTQLYGDEPGQTKISVLATPGVGPEQPQQETTHHVDGIDRIFQTERNGALKEVEFNILDQVWQSTDEEGRVTQYRYDKLGRLEATTHPDLRIEYVTRDFATSLSGDGFSYPWSSDLQGASYFKAETTTDPFGHQAIRKYDALGQLRAVAYVKDDGSKAVTYYRYDDRGNLIRIRDAEGRDSVYEYDMAGRLLRLDLPDLGGKHSEHHEIRHEPGVGTQASVFTPSMKAIQYSATLEFTDGSCGTPTFVIREIGGAELVRLNHKGSHGGMVRTTPGVAHEVLTTVSCAANGATTSVIYQTQSSLGSGWDIVYVYDLSGKLRFSQDRRQSAAVNEWTYYKYDEQGREVERGVLSGVTQAQLQPEDASYPEAPLNHDPIVSYSYDTGVGTNTEGRLAQVSRKARGAGSPHFIRDFWYDTSGHVTFEKTATWKGVGAGSNYLVQDVDVEQDWLDETIELEYPGSSLALEYRYDDRGRASKVFRQEGLDLDQILELDYFDDDRLKELLFADQGGLGNPQTTLTYTDRGRVATHQVDSDGAAVFSESFSYYPNASMHQRTTDNLATTTYFPDALGRLKSVVFDADASMAFEYDDTGTRTGVERPYGNHFSYLHEAGTSRLTKVDHLASEASVEFAHDGNGNVIAINEHVGSRGIRSHYFWYSHDNRVVRQSLATSDNLIAKESFLDGEGEPCLELRTNSAVDDVVDATIALRRGGKLLGLFEGDGTEKQRYLYADGRLFGTVDDGGLIQHCHVDGEGSVRAVTNADGSLMQRIDYFPFGEPRRLESNRYDQPFRHHKGEQELGGFTRQGARFNMARYGRFGALDPILLEAPEKKLLADPLRLHPYAYARNNPLDWMDPTGEFPAAAVAPLLGPFLANPAGLTAAAVLGGAVLAAATVSPQARELISDLMLSLLESGGDATPEGDAHKGADAAKEGGKTFPGTNSAEAPKGFEWRGKPGSTPGSKEGNWYNPKTGESLRPDLDHPGSIGPHWDYRDPSGNWFRIFPDGSQVPK